MREEIKKNSLETGVLKYKKLEIELLKETFMTFQFCCNLEPKEVSERKEEILSHLPSTGIKSQWIIDEEDWKDLPTWGTAFAPCKCAEKEGYWHYVATC